MQLISINYRTFFLYRNENIIQTHVSRFCYPAHMEIRLNRTQCLWRDGIRSRYCGPEDKFCAEMFVQPLWVQTPCWHKSLDEILTFWDSVSVASSMCLCSLNSPTDKSRLSHAIAGKRCCGRKYTIPSTPLQKKKNKKQLDLIQCTAV